MYRTKPPFQSLPDNGFTLIELMIAIALLGVLASLALPAYQNYVIRAQISEALLMFDTLKATAMEDFAVNKAIPVTLNTSSASGKYVSSVTYSPQSTNGELCTIKLIATFGNQANPRIHGGTVTWIGIPTGTANALSCIPSNPTGWAWGCVAEGAIVTQDMLPRSCQ